MTHRVIDVPMFRSPDVAAMWAQHDGITVQATDAVSGDIADAYVGDDDARALRDWLIARYGPPSVEDALRYADRRQAPEGLSA